MHFKALANFHLAWYTCW